jgi:transposase InsO family protein
MGRYGISERRACRAARYRRLHVLLRREGWQVGKERFYRVYSEEGLALRRKRPWRHTTAVHREQRRPATARNEIWSMDFVADQLADGRRFRALTVIDLFTRECLAIQGGSSLNGQDVAAALEHLRFERGLPNASTATTGPSSSVRRWTSRPTPIRWSSTSVGAASPPTTRRSNPSTVVCEKNA